MNDDHLPWPLKLAIETFHDDQERTAAIVEDAIEQENAEIKENWQTRKRRKDAGLKVIQPNRQQ
jgi:hypothetical protein